MGYHSECIGGHGSTAPEHPAGAANAQAAPVLPGSLSVSSGAAPFAFQPGRFPASTSHHDHVNCKTLLASSTVSNVKITSVQISVEYTGRHLIEYPVRSSVSVMVGLFTASTPAWAAWSDCPTNARSRL